MKQIKREIWNKIKEAEIITLFRHEKPDGDASGAQIGLKHLILDHFPNKKVYCLGEENRRWKDFLGRVDSNVSDATVHKSLAIVLDVGDIPRVDDQRFLFASEIIKIDHHIFIDEFSSSGIEWIDISASATCEMLTSLAIENGLTVSKEAAKALYTGLVSDSGRFLYTSVTKETFNLAGFLYDVLGSEEVQGIYNYIYSESEHELRFKGYCQQNFIFDKDGFAYNKITLKVLESFNININVTPGAVNVLGSVDGVKIYAHFIERENKTIKAELRSKKIPINEIAANFNGGGHRLASGAVLSSWEEVDEMIDAIKEVLKSDSDV